MANAYRNSKFGLARRTKTGSSGKKKGCQLAAFFLAAKMFN
jgi:hypothetical protein